MNRKDKNIARRTANPKECPGPEKGQVHSLSAQSDSTEKVYIRIVTDLEAEGERVVSE